MYQEWQRTHPSSLTDLDPEFIASLNDQCRVDDSTPFFIKNIKGTEELCLLVAIDHHDPEERETPGNKRFQISLVGRSGDTYNFDVEEELLFDGENFCTFKYNLEKFSTQLPPTCSTEIERIDYFTMPMTESVIKSSDDAYALSVLPYIKDNHYLLHLMLDKFTGKTLFLIQQHIKQLPCPLDLETTCK